MNIGIRLHDVKGDTIEDKLRSAAEQGFTCVHLALAKLLPGFAMEDAPSLLTPALAASLRSLLDRYALHPAVLGCYLNLATPDQAQWRRTFACYDAHLRFARMLGADVVGTETGAPNTAYRPEPACRTEESLQLLIERLKPVADRAECCGATLALEPVCRHIMCTPERTGRVLDALNSPNLAVIFDPVNLLRPDNAAQADEMIEAFLRQFGDRIRVMHLKDYRVIPGQEDVACLACGLGEMRYDRLLSFIRAHERLPVTLEDTLPDNARDARLFLEARAARL